MQQPPDMTGLVEQVHTADQLGMLLDAVGQDQVAAVVRQVGAEAVLARVFALFPGRFEPACAGGGAWATIQWDVSFDGETHHWVLDVADGACRARAGTAARARLSMAISLPDFLRLVSGRLDGVEAFLGRRLRLRGDRLLALRLGWWFGLAPGGRASPARRAGSARIGLHALRQACHYTCRTATAGLARGLRAIRRSPSSSAPRPYRFRSGGSSGPTGSGRVAEGAPAIAGARRGGRRMPGAPRSRG